MKTSRRLNEARSYLRSQLANVKVSAFSVEQIEQVEQARAVRRAANQERKLEIRSAQISPVLFHFQLDQSTKLIVDSKVLLADPSGTQAEYQVASFVMRELTPSTSLSAELNDAAGLLTAGRTFAIEAFLQRASEG